VSWQTVFFLNCDRIMALLLKLRPHTIIGLFLTIFLGVIVLSLGIPSTALVSSAEQSTSSLSITQGVEKTVLDNGLTVLTKEVHTAPVVSVQIWYRVGSRNEAEGSNGISHQLEHLLFKGTSDRPIQFGRLFSVLGSQFNAFTSYDMTAYFGTAERDKLETLLVLEADRMQNALINPEELESEKRVVISELQGYENSPDYRLGRAVMRAAFPDSPYGLPVGGTRTDVENFTVDQVRTYYETYYSPDNATLIITGDFSTEPILQKVRETFGQVPTRRGMALTSTPSTAQSSHSNSRPPASSQTPIVLQEPGSAALLNVVYSTIPTINHPDVPAIDLMDMILTGGRSSRFYQAVVESGLASSVSAYAAEMIATGWYEISATAAPGQDIIQVDEVLQKVVRELQQQQVSEDELSRAKTQLKAYYALQNQDITSQASQLGYEQTVAGDYRFGDRYLTAIDEVTAADIQRVAQSYLDTTQRTVGYFEPTLPDGQPGVSSAGGTSRTVENFSPGEPVDPAEVARYLPPMTSTPDPSPQPLPEEFTLDNGLRVLLLPDESVPMVNLGGWIDAGTRFDTNDHAGLASLTADNLMNGTQTQDALSLAMNLEDRGASLGFSAAREGVNIQGYALPESLPMLVQTLADVLQHATFPADQLELSRQRSLTDLGVELDDPQQLGWRVFRQTLYPAHHPFHPFPTEESLRRITQADVTDFYQTHYRPDATVLTLVGNVDSEDVRSLLNDAFADWQASGRQPALRFRNVPLPRSVVRLSRAIPGKSEAVTYLGYGGIARQDPRFYAATVLNQILGGDTLASRLGTEIRDRQGLTYGVFSFFQAGLNPGPFAIVMQTSPENAEVAIESTLALLRQLRDQGIMQAELDAAKRSLTSNYAVDLADPTRLASVILDNAVYELSLDELREFREKINAVTLEQVQQVVQELIHPENLIIVTAGPEETASN
jgi:zinc protease